MDELWLPGLIVVALIGLMFYALAATSHVPLFGSVGLGDIANLAVAGVTLLLVMVTRRSVKVSERALTELERPWIIVEGAKVTMRDTPAQPGQATGIGGRALNDWFISLHLKNVGRMPGLIDTIIFKIEDTATLPDAPDYTNANHLNSPATVATGETCETGSVGPAPGRPNQLTFYGRVTYRELSGHEHHTGFALDVAPYMPAFVRCSKAGYDYYD